MIEWSTVRFEQAVYGSFPFWNRGYGVLARSAGCRPEWLADAQGGLPAIRRAAGGDRRGRRPLRDAAGSRALDDRRRLLPRDATTRADPVRWRSTPCSSAPGPTGGPVPTRSPSPASCGATGAPRTWMRPCRPAVRPSAGRDPTVPMIPRRRSTTSGSPPIVAAIARRPAGRRAVGRPDRRAGPRRLAGAAVPRPAAGVGRHLGLRQRQPLRPGRAAQAGRRRARALRPDPRHAAPTAEPRTADDRNAAWRRPAAM